MIRKQKNLSKRFCSPFVRIWNSIHKVSLFSAEQDFQHNLVTSYDSNENSNDITNDKDRKNLYPSIEKTLIKSYKEYSNKNMIENSKQSTNETSIKDTKYKDLSESDSLNIQKHYENIQKAPAEGRINSKKDSKSIFNLKSSHHKKEYNAKEIVTPEMITKFESKKGFETMDELKLKSEFKRDNKEHKVIPVIDRKTLFVGALIYLARKRLK